MPPGRRSVVRRDLCPILVVTASALRNSYLFLSFLSPAFPSPPPRSVTVSVLPSPPPFLRWVVSCRANIRTVASQSHAGETYIKEPPLPPISWSGTDSRIHLHSAPLHGLPLCSPFSLCRAAQRSKHRLQSYGALHGTPNQSHWGASAVSRTAERTPTRNPQRGQH